MSEQAAARLVLLLSGKRVVDNVGEYSCGRLPGHWRETPVLRIAPPLRPRVRKSCREERHHEPKNDEQRTRPHEGQGVCLTNVDRSFIAHCSAWVGWASARH